MRAKGAYRVIVGRAGRAPSVLAGRERADHVEVVDIAAGEVVLFWDLTPRQATRFAHRLREDLAALDADEFLDRWTAISGPGDLR
jgi:hypothetical protein